MSFYNCEQCEGQFGYNEKEPIEVFMCHFCCPECLRDWLNEVYPISQSSKRRRK